jgi:hypothetical protein
MGKLPLGDDDTFGSPIERIFISTNGPESGGCDNPLRQGLSADLADSFRPNNILGIPTLALDYSPTWDAQLFTWTADAIDKGFRGQIREEFQLLTFVQDGLITGFPAGTAFGTLQAWTCLGLCRVRQAMLWSAHDESRLTPGPPINTPFAL